MRYRNRPYEVTAHAIEAIEPPKADGSRLVRTEAGMMKVTPLMMGHIDMRPGDFVVVQEGGFIYVQNKELFERKYEPLTGAV